MNKLFISLLFTALMIPTFNWGVDYAGCEDMKDRCEGGDKVACREAKAYNC